jgi:hypothetical protein
MLALFDFFREKVVLFTHETHDYIKEIERNELLVMVLIRKGNDDTKRE